MHWQLPKGDAGAILVVAAGLLVAGFVVARGRRLITEDLNPASRENIVYQGAAGEAGTIKGMDKLFAYTDLLFGGPAEKERARNFLNVTREFEQ